jgi:hypothetical protein
VSGSLRGAYWSSSRSLDDRHSFGVASLWLEAAPRLAPGFALRAEGWLRDQRLFHEDYLGSGAQGDLREAYLEVGRGPVDVRVGKQLILWGRADRINPTDNLTPRDFTLLVPDDDDQRLGVVAARATVFVGGLGLTGIWLPDFEPDRVPIRPPPAGARLREVEPDDPVTQWALRVERTGGAVDWSLSYFDGFDLVPGLGIGGGGPAGIDLVLRHHRIRVLGADAAAAAGRYGLRAEAAYTFTEDSAGRDPAVRTPFFHLVAGGDRTFLDHLNVNIQYILRVIVGYRSPFGIEDPLEREVAIQHALITSEVDAVQHGVSLRVGYRWLNETLEAEVAAVVSLERLGYVVRPRVAYAATDRWRIVVGADVFGGGRHAFYGNLRDNSGVYLEVRRSF